MAENSLYAYGLKEADGLLTILTQFRGEYNHIPVSRNKERIRRHFNEKGKTPHEIIDINPLLESRIISSDSILNVDDEPEWIAPWITQYVINAILTR